jgi:signal transduction histidine kinase
VQESGEIAARLRAAGLVSAPPGAAAVASVRDLTRTLREAAPADALQLIAGHARQCAGAELGLVVTPAAGDQLVVDAADGHGAELVRGVSRPVSALWQTLLGTGEVVIDDASLEAEAADLAGPLRLGPMLMVPLSADGQLLGAVVLARLQRRPTFSRPEVQSAGILAGYAALALTWAEEFRQQEERDGVADDLHDAVLGRLFATGLRLQAISAADLGVAAPIVATATADLDLAMADIRAAISTLRRAPVNPFA